MVLLVGDAENHLSYLRGVLVLHGAAVDRVGQAGAAAVPPAWQQKWRERDGEGSFHVTLLSKADLQGIASRLREGLAWPGSGDVELPDSEDLASIAGGAAQIVARTAGAFVWVDVGEGRASDGASEAVFRVILWPAGSKARSLLGLPPHDFHVSLGFSSHDVHGKSKGLSALVSGAPSAPSVPALASAAKNLASSTRTESKAEFDGSADGAELLASAALQGAESHGLVPDQVTALEALCLAYGRLQRPRQVLEVANQLAELDSRNHIGLRSLAISLMALKRLADAYPVLERLQTLLSEAQEEGPESAKLRTWLDEAGKKCRTELGIKLFLGGEEFATDVGDQDFENAFLTSHSPLKFPSTAHLKNLGAATRDDKVCDAERREEFCGGRRAVSVEEKVDGANLGISLDSSYCPRMQARSKQVNWKTDTQFAGLEQWLEDYAGTLCEILERNNDILFGEWCAYLHTVKYSGLPGYFLAFDIYDRRKGRFLSRQAFHTRLARAAGPKVPAVPMVCPRQVFSSASEVEALLQRQSFFGQGPLEGVYLRIDEVAPGAGERESYLVDRCKLVRAEFQQAIEEEGSWRGRGKNDLDMALASTYTDQCYPCARGV